MREQPMGRFDRDGRYVVIPYGHAWQKNGKEWVAELFDVPVERVTFDEAIPAASTEGLEDLL